MRTFFSKPVIILACSAMCATLVACAQQLVDSVSVGDVIANPSAVSQRRLSVTGFLSFGDDAHNLWESQRSWQYVNDHALQPEDPAWNKCITLFNYGPHRDDLLSHNGKMVTITGRVRVVHPKEQEVVLGSCNFIGMDIDAVN